MALSGEDKEMRSMPGSLGYDSLETLDHHSHPPPPPHIQGVGGGGGTLINSGRSKSRITLPSSTPRTTTRYRECLKNHAASTGGNITDGCGEFMPSGENGTLESFKCAACNCHRNFHRKEYSDNGSGGGALVVHPIHLPPALPSPAAVHSNHHHHHWTTTMVQPVKMAFGGGSASAATDSSSEELNFNTYQSTSVPPPPQFVLAKKRVRTKFSQDQKEKMLAFAEKLGWRIPREDDTEVQRFCAEVGVKRQVFKVWMHNNKISSSAKKTLEEPIEMEG